MAILFFILLLLLKFGSKNNTLFAIIILAVSLYIGAEFAFNTNSFEEKTHKSVLDKIDDRALVSGKNKIN